MIGYDIDVDTYDRSWYILTKSITWFFQPNLDAPATHRWQTLLVWCSDNCSLRLPVISFACDSCATRGSNKNQTRRRQAWRSYPTDFCALCCGYLPVKVCAALSALGMLTLCVYDFTAVFGGRFRSADSSCGCPPSGVWLRAFSKVYLCSIEDMSGLKFEPLVFGLSVSHVLCLLGARPCLRC